MQVATKAMEKANQDHIRTESRLHRTLFLVTLAEAFAVWMLMKAWASCTIASALIDTQGDRRWQAELFRVREDLQVGPACRAGSGQGARTSYENAIRIAQGQDAKALQLRATTSYARLLAQEGEKQRARELLEGILGWFRQGANDAGFYGGQGIAGEVIIAAYLSRALGLGLPSEFNLL